MKKRILLTVLAVCLGVLLLGTVSASAATYGDYTYTVSDGEVTITDFDDTVSGAITIPDEIENCPVTTIGGNAFLACSELTSVEIPESVTTIGVYAFQDCYSLTDITIPDSVTAIGNKAFENTAYYIDADNWENGVLYIDNHLIKTESSIEGEYEIRSGVRTIACNAFYGCTKLKNVRMFDTVTNIGSYAFYGCTELENITISQGITSIRFCTFYNCTSLAKMTIPSGVTSIEWNAFRNCKGLKEVIISDNVVSIGNYTFYGCTGLENVTIGSGIKSIGGYMFYDCTSLINVAISDSVTIISNYAFYNCNSLKNIYYAGTEAQWKNVSLALLYNGNLPYATIYYNSAINIELDKTSIKMVVGEKSTIKVTGIPDLAINKNVVWKSFNEDVATVDEIGVVAAVSGGKTTIVVMTEDGRFEAKCDVVVDIPLTETTFKTLTSIYKFYIECESVLENEMLVVACYDSDDRVLYLKPVECDGDTEYTASVPKDTGIDYAKVFLWSDYEKFSPLGLVEKVNVN